MTTEMVASPFAGAEVTKPQGGGGGNALVSVEGQRAIAETQAAMAIAKSFPRHQITAMERIMQTCTRITLAKGALYSYARGGSAITGPSIRLAEAIAQNWGNIDFGIKELDQSNGSSTVMAYAHDLETNTRQVKIFQVGHTRFTRKSGNKKLEDPRDIYEAVANQGARRLRACILGIIPGDVVEAAVEQCEATLKTNVDITPERIKSLLDMFSGMNVSKAMIETKLQRRVDAITPALMVQLGTIYNSLKDGMSVPADFFDVDPAAAPPAPEKKSATESLKDQLSGGGGPAAEDSPTKEAVKKAVETIDPDGTLYEGPWAKKEWVNMRSGDGVKTGLGKFVKDNESTFADAPADIQAEAQKKWAKVYPQREWPLGKSSDTSGAGDDKQEDDTTNQLNGFKEVVGGITSSSGISKWLVDNGTRVEEQLNKDDLEYFNMWINERLKEVQEIEQIEADQ